MSAFMHDVATAALPVAIGLLICAAAARAVLWARPEDTERTARLYLDPLTAWCLGAAAVDAVAVGAAGAAGALSLGVPLAVGAAAMLLRSLPEPDEAPSSDAPKAPATSPPPRPAAPARASLWDDGDDRTPRSGLWSRA